MPFASLCSCFFAAIKIPAEDGTSSRTSNTKIANRRQRCAHRRTRRRTWKAQAWAATRTIAQRRAIKTGRRPLYTFLSATLPPPHCARIGRYHLDCASGTETSRRTTKNRAALNSVAMTVHKGAAHEQLPHSDNLRGLMTVVLGYCNRSPRRQQRRSTPLPSWAPVPSCSFCSKPCAATSATWALNASPRIKRASPGKPNARSTIAGHP